MQTSKTRKGRGEKEGGAGGSEAQLSQQQQLLHDSSHMCSHEWLRLEPRWTLPRAKQEHNEYCTQLCTVHQGLDKTILLTEHIKYELAGHLINSEQLTMSIPTLDASIDFYLSN